jgi:hypothetical protein
MATLVPVDGDPFATSAAPSAGGTLVPVDHDPFAGGAAPNSLDYADIAKSAPIGVLKGALGALGGAGDLAALVNSGLHAGIGKAWDITGLGPQAGSPERATFDATRMTPNIDVGLGAPPSSAELKGATENVTGKLYEPTSKTGSLVQTAGEMLPGLIGGTGTKMARVVGDWLVPTIMSEGAGQLTKGSPMEGYARAGGGLAGNLITGISRARNSVADRAVQRSLGPDVTPEKWDQMAALRDKSANVGVPLSGPEIAAETTGGATAMPHLLRAVEGSTEGKAVTAPFFAERPQQVEAAVGRTLDTVGPQDANPYTLGQRTAAAADTALTQTPEGQALQEAIWRAGPSTSAEEAGSVIQPALRQTYDRREGMRNALANRDFEAARNAPAEIPVESLEAGTFTPPNRTTLQHDPALGEYQPTGGPAVEPPPEPALSSNTGPTHIQADPRDVLNQIDVALADAKGNTATALRGARGMLFSGEGLDTSVAGLSNARTQLGAAINEAVRGGDNQTAQVLQGIQRRLDETLSDVPAHAEATRGFEAASRPLDPFVDNKALDKTIARDEFNRGFTTPAEQVPGAIQQGGASTARAFNEVAPRDARDAFMNFLTTRLLDPATSAAGRVNADALTTAVRDNVDLLRQHPEAGQRLTDIIMADRGMAGPRSGPLGELANNPGGRGTLSGTQAAGDTLLPAVPLKGGEGELGQATRRLVDASASSDPQAIPSVVRQRLADIFDLASKRVQSGKNQFVGAKYANEVVGTPQQEANLTAVVNELPGGQAANQQISDLFDVLRATGQRRAEGSPTSFNQEMKDNMSHIPLGVEMATANVTAPISLARRARDTLQRVYLGKHSSELGRMFIAPDNVEQMRKAYERQLGAPISDAMMRQLIQTPVELNR